MLNHRLIAAPEDIESFVNAAIGFINKHAKSKKIFCALSGGVDSSTTYLLLKRAGADILPVFLDHGLMRIVRGVEEREYIKKTFPDVKIINIRDEFLPNIFGENDAELKRKLFKKAYSETFDKIIREENCELLADGTILPDIEESFGVKLNDLKETMTSEEELVLKRQKKGKGFVKSQHNVEIEYAVEATIQPVASLTKLQVRKVLEYFNMPQELVYRKAFPGPALAARIIGSVTPENLSFEKKVHDIVEASIDDYYKDEFGKSMIINEKGEQEPFQAFAATIEDVANSKVTGIRNNKRIYEVPLFINGEWDFDKLTKNASEITDHARIFYDLGGKKKEGRYDIVIRCVNSTDARTASVTNLPIDLLNRIRDNLLEIPESKNVYYDVTPKPPATIEYV